MAYANRGHFSSAWLLGFQWVIANALSWVAAFFVMELMYIPSPFGFGFSSLLFALDAFWNKSLPGALAGICFAIATWLVLRHRILNPGRWVISTILGFMFGVFIGDGVSSLLSIQFIARPWRNSLWDFALTGLLLGLLVGIFQWLVLKQQSTQAHWWIPASIVAWVSVYLISSVNWVVGLLANGAIIGIITGVTLIWVLRHSKIKVLSKADGGHALQV